MALSCGQFKQELMKEYNDINKSIFSMGVKEFSVDYTGNKIILMSKSGRPPLLRELDINYPLDSMHVNELLITVFKKKIKERFKEKFHLNIVAIFKDYDVETEYSVTVIVLNGNVENCLNDL